MFFFFSFFVRFLELLLKLKFNINRSEKNIHFLDAQGVVERGWGSGLTLAFEATGRCDDSMAGGSGWGSFCF